MIVDTKLISRTKKGTLVRSAARLEYRDGRIWFLNSPFALKDEIKAMQGARWHGFEEPPRKIWSVDDSPRNKFHLGFLQGEDVYSWFDRELIRHEYNLKLKGEAKDPFEHQLDLADAGLTYHYQIWAAEMGVGKTLAAQMVLEKSNTDLWWWVGPKSSLPNVQREFDQWGYQGPRIEYMTYAGLVRVMNERRSCDEIPQGLLLDESSRVKGANAQRTNACQEAANLIRDTYDKEGFVIEMSGTPSPKTPVDWWAQCEIAWPGFLREGSPKALENRLAFKQLQEFDSGSFMGRIGWRDDEKKCATCGEYQLEGNHEIEFCDDPDDYHRFQPSINEVAFMYERLKGLVVIKHKKDCLDLPDKRYRIEHCKPTASLRRVAKAIADSSTNAMVAQTLLRELSDGFQYREVPDGKTRCDHCPEASGKVNEWFSPVSDRTYSAIDMLDEETLSTLIKRSIDCPKCDGTGEMDKMTRISREVACPKDDLLRADLGRCEETGRMVVFAGFTGAIDRIKRICHGEGWTVVRVDGRGYEVTTPDGDLVTVDGREALDYWSDLSNSRVVFDAHPESGGMSFTLTESRMIAFWSNTFKPVDRTQAEDRGHRPGMDLNHGLEIVDYIHLPTDGLTLSTIRENRRLELLTMGEVMASFDEQLAA